MVVKQPFLCVLFWAGLTLLLLPRVNEQSEEKCGYIYLGENEDVFVVGVVCFNGLSGASCDHTCKLRCLRRLRS